MHSLLILVSLNSLFLHLADSQSKLKVQLLL
jgi:hypothetical protein